MKNAHRLDYQGLAASLDQRGLVDAPRLQVALTTCSQTGQPFPEILVMDDLIGDWELSRVVCELYNLPFVPVDFCTPDPEALEGFDRQFLVNQRIVPVGRFGDLVTLAMPAIVPAEILGSLSAALDVHILPVVGTVMTNNLWINENLEEARPAEAPAPLPAASTEADDSQGPGGLELPSLGELSINLGDTENAEGGGGWSNIFDEGNAAVMNDLGDLFGDDEIADAGSADELAG